MNDQNVTTKPEAPAELCSSDLLADRPPNDREMIVAALIEVARAAYALADNSECDMTTDPPGVIRCDGGDMDKLSAMLDVLDRLPDPLGEAATGPRKAEYWYSLSCPFNTQSPSSANH